ncbi:hypothetical protein A8709_16840 [Paenibacillus pectinilyticus]|uniref:Uncharacterized protein n=1 Tax=Paenibacillus pectinilyticus TaxID=512399 RepID=A0A1C1A8L3_9BACL|nr:hypothetical protein [Paenibacillus pectinilyticus]OCT16938.1 hypothetical protein A8709_16840 [Paenibacillus pectinilyticus]
MKKTVLLSAILLLLLSSFVLYQFQKPLLSQNEAIAKAEKYLGIVNTKLNIQYQTKRVEENTWYIPHDDFWHTVVGSRKWSGFIDGVGIEIDAFSGDFIQMVFPLDGIVTKEEHPDWFTSK